MLFSDFSPRQPNPKTFPPFIKKIISIFACTMPPLALLHNSCRSLFRATAIESFAAAASTTTATAQFIQFQSGNPLNFRGKALIAAAVSGNSSVNGDHPSIVLDSLRVLQWDQLCDCVATFAGTTHGKQATKVSMHLNIII